MNKFFKKFTEKPAQQHLPWLEFAPTNIGMLHLAGANSCHGIIPTITDILHRLEMPWLEFAPTN